MNSWNPSAGDGVWGQRLKGFLQLFRQNCFRNSQFPCKQQRVPGRCRACLDAAHCKCAEFLNGAGEERVRLALVCKVKGKGRAYKKAQPAEGLQLLFGGVNSGLCAA